MIIVIKHKMKLELKDKRLIYELDLDASLSIKQLAKKVGLSREATRYRVKRLVENGVITRFITYLDFVKLGYFGYAIYCRYAPVGEEKKAELLAFLKNHDKVYWIAECGGRFDLAFSIFAKNPIEFEETLAGILNAFPNCLTDITLITKLEPHKYSREYLLSKKEPLEIKYQQVKPAEEKLSIAEKKILKHLTTNARKTAAEISRETKIPLSTVIYTAKKLIQKQVISGFTILLQPTAFGFQSFQVNVVTHNTTKEKIQRLFTYCQNHPNIIFAIKVLGEWNVEIIYEVENAKKMREQLIELRQKFNDIIKDAELLNLFEDYIKLDHYPFKI